MRKLIIAAGALALLVSSTCYAGAKLKPKNNVVIYGPIDRAILDKADNLLSKAEEHGDVSVLINSPGGGVMAGYQFIQAIKIAQERGSTVSCYVSGMAASMAFQILAHCDKRYALRYSLLLWHPVRVGGLMVLTPDRAEHLASTLRSVERQLRDELLSAMPISPGEFDFHYRGETMWTAQQLQGVLGPEYIEIVDEIPGVSGVWDIWVGYRGSKESEGDNVRKSDDATPGGEEGEREPADWRMGPEDLRYIWDGWDQYPEPQLLRSCGRLRGAARPC